MRIRFHRPEDTMLARFNQSEHDRLVPVWRKVGERLYCTVLAALLVGLWALVVYAGLR